MLHLSRSHSLRLRELVGNYGKIRIRTNPKSQNSKKVKIVTFPVTVTLSVILLQRPRDKNREVNCGGFRSTPAAQSETPPGPVSRATDN